MLSLQFSAYQYGVRVGVGFYSRRARPTEVFKLVFSLGAQITRTGTYTRTHTGKRAHVLLITMALKQKKADVQKQRTLNNQV